MKAYTEKGQSRKQRIQHRRDVKGMLRATGKEMAESCKAAGREPTARGKSPQNHVKPARPWRGPAD